ncbi:MAG TPA: hypothetical protein VJ695_03390 [Nitrososphaera sp.]|nr:hypothetical protein [Nitrososphaera sp.]
MYSKIFIILIVVIASVAAIAGTSSAPVVGQQNQTSNLTALLLKAADNDDIPETVVNTTASNDTAATNDTANVHAPATFDNLTIEDAKDLYLSVWNRTAFNATFSTFVEPFSAAGYGVYEERNNIFTPDETIVLYVEPVGFGHKQVADEGGRGNNGNNNTMLYLMNMTADYEITAANGTKLQLIEDVQVGNITSHRPNTEMFLTLTITPEVQPLPVGNYVIKYSVNDEVSGESFQLEKDITVAERES